MKVAQLNAYDCGSTGKIMLHIAEVSRQNGIEAYTFSSSRAASRPQVPDHMYVDNKFDYYFHMVFGMLLGYETAFSYFATRRLIRRLKQICPDIIHLHNTHGFYLNHRLLFRYIKKNNVKVIWTLHDCWTFTGRCPHFAITGCEKWRSGCGSCVYSKKQYPASYIFDRSGPQWRIKKKMFTGIRNMMIVTPSTWLAQVVRESYLREYSVKVIHNGIDLQIFHPIPSDWRIKHGCEDKILLLGVAASWGKRKGLDVFIELAKRLDDCYQIVLVGTSDTVDKQLPGNIISIHRTQDQAELAALYTVADLFVNPTREDNFPTVNIEALACGTPVLTFRTGGSPEAVDVNTGAVVICGDIDEMEKEIIRICVQRPYLREACLARAREFDMGCRYIEYIKLYKNMQGKKR